MLINYQLHVGLLDSWTFGLPTSRLPVFRTSGLPDLPHKFPLAACSRSMASNSALKFPFPKLFAPFR
jgi:hypothetical protein